MTLSLTPALQESLQLLPQDIAPYLLAAKVLSAVALVALAALLFSLWRRESVPTVSYGGVDLSSGRMRWLWTTFLVGSTLAAAAGNPIVTSSSTYDDPDLEASLPSDAARRQSSVDLPLPFYQFARQRVTVDGQLLHESVTEGIPVPWGMMTAFLAYFIMVVRWNPENRWALRILRGKRWVKKNLPKR